MPESINLPELLAPAGNPAMLHAVITAGADAAYLGMGELNARRSADNFNDETLAEACDYAHLRGSNIYVAMNTIVLPEEMDGAVRTAKKCVQAGADAFIVQDLGLAVALSQHVPEARLHASTQMSIHSKDGIVALAELGFKRATLARELSLGEIEALCAFAAERGVEVETFAHGALCVCYSGQCLMSSMIGGRSANRGLCAQACRLPYRLVDLRDPDRQLKSPGEHLLSPKDLCLVENVAELAAAGVSSLKIEGRMKSPEYAFTSVSVYRQALGDMGTVPMSPSPAPASGAACQNGDIGTVPMSPRDTANREKEDFKTRLGSVFSRGFTTAYFDGRRGNEIMSYQRPNNRGQFVGRIKSVGDGFVELACEQPLVEGDLLEVWTGRGNFTIKVDSPVKVSGKVMRLAVPEGEEKGASMQARPNDRVFRVRSADAAYVDDDREPRVPVSGKVTLAIGKPLHIEFWLANDDSTVGSRLARKLGDSVPSVVVEGSEVEAARTRAVTLEDVADHIDRLGQTSYRLVDLEIDMDEGVGIGFSQLHHIRTDALNALTERILEAFACAARGEGAVLGQSSLGENVHWTFSFAAESARGPSPRTAHGEAEEDASKRDSAGQEIGGKIGPSDFEVRSQAREVFSSDANDIRIAVVATNPECARAAKRAGAHDILVPALNYKRGQAQYEGMLAGEPSQTPFPKKCILMIPAITHDAEGMSREALLDEDVWANVAEGQSVVVEGLGALHHAQELGCQLEIGSGLPLVNRYALQLASALEATRVWLSPELNLQQIAKLASDPSVPRLGLKVAGAQELMVTEHCMLMSQGECNEQCQSCTRRRVPHGLEDRKGYIFPVITDALGRSHLYNSVELDNAASIPELISAGITDLMIDATLMSPEQCAQATGRIAKAIQVWIEDGNAISKLPKATTGHLHRGVK